MNLQRQPRESVSCVRFAAWDPPDAGVRNDFPARKVHEQIRGFQDGLSDQYRIAEHISIFGGLPAFDLETNGAGYQGILAPSATGVDQVLAVFPERTEIAQMRPERVKRWRLLDDVV